jgi:hypothetical protein
MKKLYSYYYFNTILMVYDNIGDSEKFWNNKCSYFPQNKDKRKGV